MLDGLPAALGGVLRLSLDCFHRQTLYAAGMHLYRHLPSISVAGIALGGWGGQADTDICVALAPVTDSVIWRSLPAEACAEVIARRFYGVYLAGLTAAGALVVWRLPWGRLVSSACGRRREEPAVRFGTVIFIRETTSAADRTKVRRRPTRIMARDADSGLMADVKAHKLMQTQPDAL